jgi:ABC-type Mn2+/Zn2+ transport system ATPase subunit
MGEILRAEGICAGWGGTDVIRGPSFTLSQGEVLAVVGPNGSGKTTLLKAMLGLLPLRAGRLTLFGRERLRGAEAERLIAYIPQRLEIDRTFPISLREMLGLSVRGGDIERYLDMLELRGLLSLRVGELSGGQMQRALLAYAVIKEPALLVMDEPTSWVDARGADCILCIVEEFSKKGIAMVMVTHDYSAVSSVSTHVLGLGPEGYFYEEARGPALEEKVLSLFGTTHHHGHGPLICPLPPPGG